VSQFRCSKSYTLDNQTGDDHQTVVRLRSIPRKHHKRLAARHFTQDPALNSATLRGLEMRPTQGLEIVMVQQGRTLARALNNKRKMTVRQTTCLFSFWQRNAAAAGSGAKTFVALFSF
jgi:hypothetical protein